MTRTRLKSRAKTGRQSTGKSAASRGPNSLSIEADLHPALCHYLGYCLNRSALRMRASLESELAALHLSPPHLGLLVILETGGTLNQLRLGEEMAIDKASMVKLIDGLESLKLVERVASDEDRRVKFVRITAQGRKMKARAIAIAKQVERTFLSKLTAKEISLLREILPKLVR